MKYAPGSFSKNFAWHGTGLKKLHTSIISGFSGKLIPVGRQQWRDASGIGDPSLELIPVNFFLHNSVGKMSVDELVLQAVQHPHSIRFDRLALFALHLNRNGSGKGVVSRPAMWANEYVRERLWSAGRWQAASLQDGSLDAFIADRMDAQQDVRIKCRNNYRHLYELCAYWPAPLQTINSGADQWMASALFLSWDRHSLDGGNTDKSSLIGMVSSDQLYRLLGVSEGYALRQADSLADLYISSGGPNRVTSVASAMAVKPAPSGKSGGSTTAITTPVTSLAGKTTTPVSPPELPEETGIDWVDQEGSDEVVERRTAERSIQKSNRKKAAALKLHYDNKCMFCGIKLQVAEGRYYSEAAHIKPLGKPHDGPDKIGNMLVLCPNHHLQFDWGILRMVKSGTGFKVLSSSKGDPLNGRMVTSKHTLDEVCIDWHNDWFKSR